MDLHGKNFIGKTTSAEGSETFEAADPAAGGTRGPLFHAATGQEIDRAASLAAAAFEEYRRLPAARIAGFLGRMAEELDAAGGPLIERARLETALPEARLQGELQRTTGQIRLFAQVVREGWWLQARIDHALPDRKPLPRPDLRRMLIPLGPVAVFGASNFPFAFSVPGGDTASALAAGNPVIVKAHPAHPGTSELAASAILRAADSAGMPDGVFSLLHGGAQVGTALVSHDHIQAVGFTGSLRAGRALFDAAAARKSPIPVYAEMGSVNPVFILPRALEQRGRVIVEGLKQSVTLGVGQFCTNPGLVVAPRGEALEQFVRTAAEKLSQAPAGTMLYEGLCTSYGAGLDRVSAIPGVRLETTPEQMADVARSQVSAALFSTTGARFLEEPALGEEVFGPSTIVVACGSAAEMERVARSMEGQLTATVHGTPEDLHEFRDLVSILETKVGRLIFNGFPTGVEVSHAMHHGGPYPASTEIRSTSVGSAAIERFARPICYQDFPQDLLPVELQDANERHIWRLIDGKWEK